MIVKCCKCFNNTKKLRCPKCDHSICTSCKNVERKSSKKMIKRKENAQRDGVSGKKLE